MKEQKGITLIALTITVIVLVIIIGVSIGAVSGSRSNIKMTKNNIYEAELAEVQQIIMETYTKYKQTNNENLFKGRKIDGEIIDEQVIDNTDFAQQMVNAALESEGIGNIITLEESDDYYYFLNVDALNELGIEKSYPGTKEIKNDDSEDVKYYKNFINNNYYIYLVNYATGAVFNLEQVKTETGTILYIY